MIVFILTSLTLFGGLVLSYKTDGPKMYPNYNNSGFQPEVSEKPEGVWKECQNAIKCPPSYHQGVHDFSSFLFRGRRTEQGREPLLYIISNRKKLGPFL